jgi:signal transduction histidine kinase
VSEIANEVQAISHRLHSSKLEYLGIVAAAESFCKEFSQQQQVEVDFGHKDIPRTILRDTSLCLFRVLQEALHNAVKHSAVRHFEVKLKGLPDEVELTVRDLGMGFDSEAVLTTRD